MRQRFVDGASSVLAVLVVVLGAYLFALGLHGITGADLWQTWISVVVVRVLYQTLPRSRGKHE